MATEDFRIVRLVNRAKAGNQAAFKRLLKMVEPDLKKIAPHFFIVGGDREDVMQELRLGVFKAVNSYDCTKDTTFKNFCVNLVCKRHLATAIASAKRMKNSALNDSISLDAPFILNGENKIWVKEILILKNAPRILFVSTTIFYRVYALNNICTKHLVIVLQENE